MACVKYLLFLFNLIFAVSNGRGAANGARARTRRGTTRRRVPLFGPLFSASRRLASRLAYRAASRRLASRFGRARALLYISVKPQEQHLGLADLHSLRLSIKARLLGSGRPAHRSHRCRTMNHPLHANYGTRRYGIKRLFLRVSRSSRLHECNEARSTSRHLGSGAAVSANLTICLQRGTFYLDRGLDDRHARFSDYSRIGCSIRVRWTESVVDRYTVGVAFRPRFLRLH